MQYSTPPTLFSPLIPALLRTSFLPLSNPSLRPLTPSPSTRPYEIADSHKRNRQLVYTCNNIDKEGLLNNVFARVV